MNISTPFIMRPVMTTLLTLWLLLIGIIGYVKLPINALPKIDFPVIQVSANLPGAGPETMAQSVALILEQKFSSIPGLEVMTSNNAQGMSSLTLQFALDIDINAAAQDVSTAISSAQSSLPPAMTALPTFKKINPAEQPIVFIALTSSTLPLWRVNQFSQNLVTRLSMLPNVAQVEIMGAQKYATRVYVRPEILKLRDLSLNDIATFLNKANINPPTGVLQGPTQAAVINPASKCSNAAEFAELMLPTRDGLRLKDIAHVVDDVENLYSKGWFNEEPSLILAISRQPGSNTVQVAQNIQHLLPQLTKGLPESIHVEVMLDRSEPIRDAIKDVELTCILTIFLVVFVIFLFLRNASATFIPSISLPISILIGFALMWWANFSLNNLTLLAITLSVGFIIDDAIVVLENIVGYCEKGMSPLNAAIEGTKEIGFTVISMTISLLAVFIPIIMMPGIVGRLLYEFAITIVMVVLASCFVSLTLIPMMCRYWLKPDHHGKQENAFYRYLRLKFESLESAYSRTLKWTMRHQGHVLKGNFAILGLTLLLYMFMPKGFFPNEDTGLIYGVTESVPEVSFEAMERSHIKLMKLIHAHPDVEVFKTSIGSSSTTVASNEGRFFIRLKPLSARKKGVEQVMEDLRASIATLPDLKASLQSLQNLNIGGVISKSQYQFTIQAENFRDLSGLVPQFEDAMRKHKGFLDVNNDLKNTSLQIDLAIDRDRASHLGIEIQDITDTINSAYGDRQVSTIYSDIDTYQVILAIERSQAKSVRDLDQLYVRSKSGELVPLSAVTKATRKNAPLTINHLNRLAAATISFNLAPSLSLGDAIEFIHGLEHHLDIPPTVTTSFLGAASTFQQSQSGQLWILLGAILTIYIILGVLYESYLHPLTILTGLPSAGLGALIALILLGYNLDLIGMIGIILLVGIVKKNAIMMIDYAITLQRGKGMNPEKAIVLACVRRFRPIMMTTMAAIMGAVPIALGMGAGAELRKPLGIAIIGGLCVSQWLTLYITPVFYVRLEKLRARFYATSSHG